MLRTTLFAAAVGLGAAPALALTQSELDRFLTVVAEVGCVVTAQTGPVIEAQTGFDQAKLMEIITFLAQQQALSAPDAATLRISAGPCAGG